jgi:DNA-directed RNA polymerase specialized sigma24 family protein
MFGGATFAQKRGGAFTADRLAGLPTVRTMATRGTEDPRSADPDRATGRVRTLLGARDDAGASREALLAYGPEIYGFVLGVLEDPASATSLYADVQKRMETELGGFVQRCSLRTWLYVLARRELRDRRLQGRNATVSRAPLMSGDRRMTPSNAISNLRTSLTQEEHELLILRVDRKLTWRDLALTELGERAVASDQIAMAMHVVRERVESVIQRLRRAAAAEMSDLPNGRRS